MYLHMYVSVHITNYIRSYTLSVKEPVHLKVSYFSRKRMIQITQGPVFGVAGETLCMSNNVISVCSSSKALLPQSSLSYPFSDRQSYSVPALASVFRTLNEVMGDRLKTVGVKGMMEEMGDGGLSDGGGGVHM